MRRHSRVAVSALAALAIGLTVAACGGSGSTSTTGTTTTAGASAAPVTSTAPGSNAGDPHALQAQFVNVVKAVSPTVVQIEDSTGLGSGVVYDGQGDIVTNAHVVEGSQSFTVTLADGKRYQASLVGTFTPDDLAVIRVRGTTPPAARFSDSSKLQVGDFALAIGNPLGLRSSVTQGLVSSLGRNVSEGNGVVLPAAIQTSAPINPGNSGGALVDLDGGVIGIPTLAAADPQLGGGAAPGIGFAIPSNTVTSVATQLIKSGKVTRSGRAELGVEVASTVLGQGVVVSGVLPGGGAEKAGIRPGDVIVSVDGQQTPTTDELGTVLAGLSPGRRVPVAVADPNGGQRTVQVTLGQLSSG